MHAYGWDTLASFALRGDKTFFSARDGEAFLAYTYIAGHALVAGDPVGRRESVIAVLDEFPAMCEERAWTPALLAVREASMPLYGSRGFSAFYLGDEAIRTSSAPARTRSSCCASPPTTTAYRAASCGSSPRTGPRSATRSTSCATTPTRPTG